ncbi:MAG: molybdopterin molybdotransferase MoeA [bacterium]
MLKESIPIKEAKEIILNNTKSLGSEVVSITESLGRYVYIDIASTVNIPPTDNSAMDGFAVISDDILYATKEHPVTLKVIDEIYAGKNYNERLMPGTCVRIFTGAKIPDGADAVVRQEDVIFDKQKAIFTSPVTKGTDIREAGEDVKKGQIILSAGDRISSAAIGMLAALNIKEIEVFKKPKVFVLATGNELLELGSNLSDGKIVNSNSYALSALIAECGAEPINGGISDDNESSIINAFRSIGDADIVITTGGVSVGEYDLVKDVFAKLGVKWLFWKVKIRPGHPVAFGILDDKLFFGLPGNPVSSMVTFDQFVRIAILKMMGAKETERLRFYAISKSDIRKKPDRTHFLRARLFAEDGLLYAEALKNQSSAAISSMLSANSYIILEENRTRINKGDKVLVELFKI